MLSASILLYFFHREPYLIALILIFNAIIAWLFMLNTSIFVDLSLGMGVGRSIQIHIGLYFVSMRIRNTILFAYPTFARNIIVFFPEDREEIIYSRRALLRFVRGKNIAEYYYKDKKVAVVEGVAVLYDPERRRWIRYRGSIPIVTY